MELERGITLICNRNKIWVGINTIILSIVMMSVLVVLPRTVYSSIIDKNFIFILIIPINTFCLITSLFWGTKTTLIKIGRTDILVFLFFLFLCINQFIVQRTNATISFNLLFSIFLFYVNLRIAIIRYRIIVKFLLRILILILFIETIIGWLQLYNVMPSNHSLFKITGTFFNPGPYANYLSVIFPLALYNTIVFYRRQRSRPSLKNNSKYILSLVIVILTLSIVFKSDSRTAWVALAVSSLYLIYRETSVKRALKSYLNGKRQRIILICVSLLIIFFLSYALYNYKIESSHGRILIWKVTWSMFMEHPLFGVGLDNFAGCYSKAQVHYFLGADRDLQDILVAGNPSYAFNDYLQIISQFGICSFFLFVSTVCYVLIGLYRQNSILYYCLISLLITSALSYSLNLVPFLTLFVFIIATTQMNMNYKVNIVYVKVLLLISMSFSTYVIISDTCKYNAYSKWFQIRTPYKMNGHRSIVKDYEDMWIDLNHEGQFVLEYCDCLINIGRYEECLKLLNHSSASINSHNFYIYKGLCHEAIGNNQEALMNYKYSFFHSPNKMRPLLLQANLYKQLNCQASVDSIIQIAIKLPLKIRSEEVMNILNDIKTLQE